MGHLGPERSPLLPEVPTVAICENADTASVVVPVLQVEPEPVLGVQAMKSALLLPSVQLRRVPRLPGSSVSVVITAM